MPLFERIRPALVCLPLVACQGTDVTNDPTPSPSPTPSAQPSDGVTAARKELNPRLLRRFVPLRESLESAEHPLTQSEGTELGVATTNTSGEGSCGDKDLPDCPLQGWMKATLKPYLAAQDTARLARALEEVAEKAPPGFDGSKETAQESAKAAGSGDLTAAKAGCKHCHDAHRSRYRKELRSVAIF